MNALDAALGYSRRGWAVLPLFHPITTGGCACGNRGCPSVGKHPRVLGGAHAGTTDESAIREWWRRWPRANVGIATGAVSGFDVLDVDPRNGGDDTLATLTQEHGAVPETVEQVTGGGGRHLLFLHIAGLSAKLGPGLDVRTDGNLIVAPPSRHGSGNLYSWELSSDPDEISIAPWPAWLLNLAQSSTPTTPTFRRGTVSGKPIPVSTWSKVLAGCKRLRELHERQREAGVSYSEWLAVAAVARLGGADAHLWMADFTADYARGCNAEDLQKAIAWMTGNLRGAGTCVGLGCHPGMCGFRTHLSEAGEPIPPSPLRHAWGRTLSVEVA
jgi:hypothetical protein